MQVSLLFFWLSSRLPTFSASAGPNSSFTRAVILFKATSYAQCHEGLCYGLH